MFTLPGAILYCEPLLFTIAKKSALPAPVVVVSSFKSKDKVPVDVIVPPVIPVPLATDVTPEDVTYLPSRSTVTSESPDLPAVNTPVLVFHDKLSR